MQDSILNQYLDAMVQYEASDMYLTVGCPPSIRGKDGKLSSINSTSISAQAINTLLDKILNKEERNEFESTLELNLSIAREDKSRFRFNFFKQQQYNGMVIRRINTKIPTLEELGLPKVYSEMAMKKRGLIILASPGGSGKSTSMAAMISHRNKHGTGHILTIEDPIEFVHEHAGCIITQREVGSDTDSFSTALRNALRQRADVISIGEIRDRDSMDHAIRFSETGHLCIATLHSTNAYQAVDRMVNLFPDEARMYVLKTLSQNLLAVISQRLIPNRSESNSLATEILLNQGLIKVLIADDKINEIKEAMERSRDSGMRTFDQSLFELYSTKEISLQTAIAESDNPSALKLKINQSDLSPIDLIKNQETKDNF